MSTTVDERIVEMKFDNKQFEENAQQSMTTLEKLKSALKLDGVAKGFKDVGAAANSVNMDGLASATETVSLKFSAMEIAAITALQNITNKAIDTGLQLVKSVTVDQVAAGFSKFGEKTQSVGTLISQGFNLSEVNDQLEKLNWFTDETSYNFVDMVGNIGKFTASGQSLDDSVESMMGIANWAALSGQNAQKASMAMYQLSQAMGKGALKYDDWKSIQNASMDTIEFRQKAVEAALAVGTLTKAADGLYSIVGKEGTFSLNELFISEQLTKGMWLDSATMIETFKNYAGAVDQIYDKVQASGGELLASEAIKEMNGQLDDFQLKAFRAAQEARTWEDVVDSLADAASTSWMNIFEDIFGDYEDAKKLWTDMANSLYDVFVEPINGIEEVLSRWNAKGGRDLLLDAFSGLGEVVQSVIGPIQEAWEIIFPEKDIRVRSSMLVEATRKFGEAIRSLTLSDSAQSGIQTIFKVIFSAWKGIVNVAKIAIKIGGTLFTVVWKVFDALLSGVGIIGDFVSGIINGVKETEAYQKAMDTAASIIDKVKTGVTNLIDNFGALENKLKNMPGVQKLIALLKDIKDFVSEKVSAGLGKIFEWFGKLGDAEFEMPTIDDLASAIDFVADKLADFINWCDENFSWVGEIISGAFDSVSKFFNGLGIDISLPGILTALGDAFAFVRDVLISIKDNAGGVLGKISDLFNNLFGGDSNAGEKISSIASSIKEALGELFSSFDADKVMNAVKIAAAIVAIYLIVDSLRKLHSVIGGIASIPKSINNILFEVKNTLVAYQDQLRAGVILKVAAAIGILAASIIALSFLDPTTLTTITAYLIGLLLVINLVIKTLNKRPAKEADGLSSIAEAFGGFLEGLKKALSRAATMIGIAAVLVGLAVAIGILVHVIKQIVTIEGDVWRAYGVVVALGVLLAALASALIAVSNLTSKGGGQKIGAGLALTLIAMAGAIAILATVAKKMDSIKWESLGKTGALMAGAFGIIAGALILIGKFAKHVGASTLAVAGMTLIFGLLVFLVKRVESISWETLGKAGALMVGAFGLIGAAVILIGNLGKNLSGAVLATAAMTAIFGGLIYLVKQMEGIDWSTLGKAAAAFAGALAIIGLFLGVMSQFSVQIVMLGNAVMMAGIGLAAGGVAMLAFGAGIALLSQYLVPLANAIIEFATIVSQNGSAIVDAFTVLIQSIAAAIVAAAPFVVTAGYTLILALAAAIVATLPQILNTLGYVLLEIVNWLYTASKILGEVLLGVVINVLNGLAMAIWNNSEALWNAVQNIINALLMLILDGIIMIADEILLVIDSAFGRISPSIHNAMENVRAGLKEATDNIKEDLKPQDIEQVTNDYANGFNNGLSNLLPGLKETFGGLTNTISGGLSEGEQEIEEKKQSYQQKLSELTGKDTQKNVKQGADDIVGTLTTSLGNGVPGLESVAGSLTDAFGGTLSSDGALAALTGGQTMDNELLKALTDPEGMSGAAATDVNAYLDTINKADGTKAGKGLSNETASGAKNSKAMSDAGSSNAKSYSSGVSSQKTSAKRAAVDLAQESVYGAKTVVSNFEEAGKEVGNGFIRGIRAKIADAERAGAALGRAGNTGLRNEDRIQSPSKVTMQLGNYTAEGFIIGILELQSKVEKAGASIGAGAVDGINSAISYVSDIINGNLEMDPTIRPVLDTSLIQNGLNSVDGLLASQRSMALAAGVSLNANNVGPTLEQQIGTAVDNALNKIYDKIEEASAKTPYQINVPLNIDKRQFARATATVTREELDRADYYNNRKAGIA